MLKKTLLMVAVAALSSSAMAGEDSDDFWKKGFEGTTYLPSNQSGVQNAEEQNAERQAFERAGFPQFAN